MTKKSELDLNYALKLYRRGDMTLADYLSYLPKSPPRIDLSPDEIRIELAIRILQQSDTEVEI